MTYDIVYSILCHESPECVIDMLRNIDYYHRHLSVLTILHVTETLKEQLHASEAFGAIRHVIVNEATYAAQTYTYSILQKHVDNFRVALEHDFTACTCLASNCMFVKRPCSEWLDNVASTRIHHTPKGLVTDIDVAAWWWPVILSNKKIMRLFGERDIGLCNSSIEGWTANRDALSEIVRMIDEMALRESVETETVFEEFVLASLHGYLTGFNHPGTCHVRYYGEISEADVDQIRNDPGPICCVKRIHRDFVDPVRVYIRETSGNYDLERDPR